MVKSRVLGSIAHHSACANMHDAILTAFLSVCQVAVLCLNECTAHRTTSHTSAPINRHFTTRTQLTGDL